MEEQNTHTNNVQKQQQQQQQHKQQSQTPTHAEHETNDQQKQSLKTYKPHNFRERTKIYEAHTLQRLTVLATKREVKPTRGDQIPKVETSTFYWAHKRLALRKSHYSLIDSWYTLVTTKYERICYLLCAKEALIDPEATKLLSDVFSVIKMYPDLVLDIANLIDDPPVEIQTLLTSNQMLKPSIQLVKEGFKFDPVTSQVLDARYRYLINMDGMQIRKYLDDKKAADFNVKVNSELFLQLSNQSRWNNIWVQIAVSLFYMDTVSQNKALQNTILRPNNTRRFGNELVTFQTIAFILKQWVTLPFTVRQDGIIDINSFQQTWTTCQIPLLYSLLELSKEERGCNVTADFLAIMIKYRITAAMTSFETVTLDKKGIYSSMLKCISSSLQKYARLQISHDYKTQRLRSFDSNCEIFTSPTEMTDLWKKIHEKADPEFVSLFQTYLGKLNKGTHTQNTELARWLSGVVLTMGNVGIYYKTSLVLEKEKSVAAQTTGTLNFPKPSKLWVFNDTKMDLITEWSSGDIMYSEIAKRYKEDVLKYIHMFNTDNLQEWFYTLLTNRSQGFKVNVEQFVTRMNIDYSLLSELKNVGQVRVASFLLDNEVFSSFSRYVDTLQQEGICTIRFQNNRRARIVEIVPNVDQIGYALVLRVFEEIKADVDEIAVGKQIGGIVDMAIQLRTSGLDNGISIFSDVSAMDAHTQPNVAVMFLKMLAEVIIDKDVGPNSYFPFSTQLNFVQDTDIVGKITKEPIPALAQTLLFIASQRLNKKYTLKDKIFNCIIEINPTIFESGRFDTSAQHTTLLRYAADVVYERLKLLVPSMVGKTITYQRKFGDDSYEAIETNGMSLESKNEMVKKLIELTDESLIQVGLKAETELSAYYGDFLQQMAFCGVAVPKSARSSIYTDEKSALVTRDVFDLITNLANIITASAQRCYAPDNVITLVRNIWAVNKMFRLMPSKPVPIGVEMSRYIKVYGDRSYIDFPYIMICLPPLNFPNQTFKFANGLIMPATSSLRTVGLCKLNYIWNEVFPIEQRSKLFKVLENTPSKVQIFDGFKVFQNELAGTDIVESLVFMSFKRNQQLNERRYDKLRDPIWKMGKIATNYFNQEMLHQSYMASLTLKDTFGIVVPEALSYYMKPVEQLKNMFETKGETKDESQGLNDLYIQVMNTNLKKIPQDIVDKIINTCVFWNNTEELVEGTPDENGILPLMPGYSTGSDYYCAMNILGNALGATQRMNKALTTFTARFGNGYNLEAIHRIGALAKAAGNKGNDNAFALFLSVMQLPPRIEQAVEQMFSTDDFVLLPDLYSSGFQPETMFALSDSLSYVYGYLTFSNHAYTRSFSTIIAMYRDYLLLTAHRFDRKYKVQPELPPMTYLKFNLRSMLRSIGRVGM